MPLTMFDGLYLATLGGAVALGMEQGASCSPRPLYILVFISILEIGNFGVGKSFDALLVDVSAHDSPIDLFEGDTAEDIFSKFIFCGDDRNVVQAYCAGRLISERPTPVA